jgi:hypothetical protein
MHILTKCNRSEDITDKNVHNENTRLCCQNLLASAPKRGASSGMKSDFVKGRQQLLGLFISRL